MKYGGGCDGRSNAKGEKRIDCSHLVHEVCKLMGINYQYKTCAEWSIKPPKQFKVTNNPKPGDIVVITNKQKLNHMGIFVNEKVILSATCSGGVRRKNQVFFPWTRRNQNFYV